MLRIQRKFFESRLLILMLVTLLLLSSLSATAQDVTNSSAALCSQDKIVTTRKTNEMTGLGLS